MRFGKNVTWCFATIAIGSALVMVSASSGAQNRNHDQRGDHSRGNNRDWDGNRDHSSRDRNWETRHHRRPGQVLTDYPDFSTWHVSGGLYSVNQFGADRSSDQPWRRQRAAFFAHASINLGGHNYARATITKNGRQYYSFRFGGG